MAHDVEVNGIYYNIDPKKKQLVVTHYGTDPDAVPDDKKYTGVVNIPPVLTGSSGGGSVSQLTVVGIDDGAFKNCTGLTSVTIPKTVTSMGSQAFWGCTGLTSVTIPGSVTTISTEAFYGCYGLTSVTIQVGVTTIEDYAFSDCTELTKIEIPQSVTMIWNDVFSGCTAVTQISCWAVTPPTIDSYTFGEVKKNVPLYVPAGCGEAYKAADFWDEFTNIQEVGVPIDGIYYKITDATNKTMAVTYQGVNFKSYNEYTGSVTIPESVTYNGETYSVTEIGSRAFSHCTGLTSVTIPESVTEIGSFVFSMCTGLTEFTIPQSVTKLGSTVFNGCTAITQITCWAVTPPATQSNTFDSVGKSNPLYVPTGSGEAYKAADYWKEFTNIQEVGVPIDGIYYKITDATNKTMAVTYQGTAYDSYNEYTGSVTIPDSVTYNGEIYYVTAIDNSAFAGCTGLTSVTIPESVTAIGDNAFINCSGLKSVTMHNGVVTIGAYAFAYCSQLTEIEFPKTVTTIGDGALGGCTAITQITCWAVTPPATQSNTFANVGKSNPVYVPTGSGEAYKAADYWKEFTNITEIGVPIDGIYYKITDATKQTMAVTFKGIRATSYKEYTDSVTIPASVTYNGKTYSVTAIGVDAFVECTGLTEVTIGNSITSIGRYAFRGCSGLTELTIPESVTEIGIMAFSGCTALTQITCLATIPPTIASGTFDQVDKTIPLYVPTGSGEAYKAADYWKEFTNITEIGVPIDGIYYMITDAANQTMAVTYQGAAYDSYYNEYTGSVTIPASVTYNGKTYSVTAIEECAFFACSGLTSVTIPESVTEIGVSAFLGCSGLTSVTIPNSVTTFGDGVFGGCTGLTSVTIPESVTKIGDSAFLGCTGLTEITIPKGVTKIGNYAFSGCTALTQITCLATMPPAIQSNTFNQVDKSIPLYVPEGSSMAYKAANYWKEFTNIQELENTVLATAIALDKTTATMVVGDNMKLTATITPANVTNSKVTWSSNNTAIATVDSMGNVVAVAEGTAIITVATTDGSNLRATCEIKVEKAEVLATAIALDKTTATMVVGDNMKLTATITPANVTNSKVTWSSNNTAIATVDSMGNVVAVAEGTAIITVATTDGSNLTAQCTIEVTQPSGIDNTGADGMVITAENGAVVVKNAPMGSVVYLYTIAGTLETATQIVESTTRIAVNAQGIYLVRVDDTVKKVLL